jgi:hypothetical protein
LKTKYDNCNKSRFFEKGTFEEHVTKLPPLKVRNGMSDFELCGGSRRDFGVPFPSWATSTKFSGWSGTAHLTKNRKIDSLEENNPKFSRRWSLNIFSNAISSSSFFRTTRDGIEEVEKKSEKTREESREKARKPGKPSRKVGKAREESENSQASQ